MRGEEVYLKMMKVMMVAVSATRDTLTPTIPITCRDSTTPSSVWMEGGR